jgi:hypothetical protein
MCYLCKYPFDNSKTTRYGEKVKLRQGKFQPVHIGGDFINKKN